MGGYEKLPSFGVKKFERELVRKGEEERRLRGRGDGGKYAGV